MSATRGFWPLRDLPVVGWLVATVVVALAHPFLPAPRWLMIHLLLLGAVSHAILVWSRYFTDAVLHARPEPGERRVQSTRLLLLNGGVLAVVVGVVAGLWPLTAAGAATVATAVGWHGAALVRRLRRALPARFGVTVRYYVAAAALLPVGATLGVLLAGGLDDPLHGQARLAHASVNLLGWMGLTVVGTLVTLWPTMLGTRMSAGSERAAARALPVLSVSVVAVVVAALLGSRLAVAAGMVGYLGGLGLVAVPFVRAALARRPSTYPSWSVLAGVGWLLLGLTGIAVGVATAGSWQAADDRVSWLTPFLAVGFGAQVLLGALSYLVPVALGGGPTAAREAGAVLDRGGALRVGLVNGGLLLSVLPVPSPVRVAATVLVLGALAAFVPLLLLAVRSSRRLRAHPAGVRPTPRDGEAAHDRSAQVRGMAASAVAVLALAVAVGVAVDPSSVSGAAASAAAAAPSAGVAPTGETRTVAVTADDMRFSPATITVPAGTRLVVDLTNTDDEAVHDLVLDTGVDSGRLAPGESTTVDVGVVGADVAGWCSVVGHQQMGMTLAIEVTGGGTVAAGDDHDDHAHGPGTAPEPPDRPRSDPEVDPGTGPGTEAGPGTGAEPAVRRARDAELAPLGAERVHRRTLTVREVEQEVAPGVTQLLWTYDGTAPGPTLHGRVGDVFEITLVNDGSIGHSIDFHAGALAPDRPMRTIAPGQSLTYRFTATRAGVWMYHCSTMPMSAHIANGMFGAVVIEPDGLPAADRSYLLVQSEQYHGPDGEGLDLEALAQERPDAVVFNGYPNQYDTEPLVARVGERVRVWVLDAGPNRSSSFHVVGGQFDTVWSEGAYLLGPEPSDGGAQVLALAPAQGGFVELSFPEPGRYPFVSHVMVDAERGAHGIVDVTG